MAGAGFEPAPPERLGPYPSALDHSATQPIYFVYNKYIYIFSPAGLEPAT